MTVASVNKRTTESKYVSCFTDSRPDVDITFRDVLLSRPTDHYLVGVDNFSLTSTSLSMIEPSIGDYEGLIRIVRNRTADNYVGVAGTSVEIDVNLLAANKDLATIRVGAPWDFEVNSNEVFLSVQQLMHRLNELAEQVTLYMRGATNLPTNEQEIGYAPGTAQQEQIVKHLEFKLRSDGKVRIIGTRAFWANFSISVPNPQYQFGFYGERQATDDNPLRLRRYLSVHPITGAPTFNKIRVNNVKFANPATADERAYNTRTIFGHDTKVLCTTFGLTAQETATVNSYANAVSREEIVFKPQASIFSTLERRVALELGCSLPIKNSPMIDHQKESPDFVLGRWIWQVENSIAVNDSGNGREYQGSIPVCTQYQGPNDRITYHELQAQSKIQTVRMKLFARVRTFNVADESWGMRVVQLPTSSTDWWHTRLHFVSKD